MYFYLHDCKIMRINIGHFLLKSIKILKTAANDVQGIGIFFMHDKS